ncbi:hypothetical protein Tco_0687527 [Tanacetum coccineum]
MFVITWSYKVVRISKSENKGKVPTEMELVLEQTQQGNPDGRSYWIKTSQDSKPHAHTGLTKTILLGIPEDNYAAVDSCKTAQEIWFTSTDGESIESYYHRFSKLMNDFKRNKHFPKKIASNLKFLNNLQHEWNLHVTIVHQTKDLHTADYTQLYDFLKYNQKEKEAGIQLQAKEFDLMAVSGDIDEIDKVNANCILMANLQRASTSGTQTDKAPVYNSDGSAEQAQQKQQSLYNGNVLLEKHDPLAVYDSEETLQLAQEIRLKMKQLNKEIKPANYTKINHLSGVFVSQTAKSRKELYFSNTSKTVNVSKSISIPNEEFLDDTTQSFAPKFINEVKSTIVTLQRVVKQKMTLDIHNWSFSVHQEIHKIGKDEIFPIINQVDARVQNFKIQLLKEANKFVRDFKSLAKEDDESLAKYKALELEIGRLLRAVVSQDIMSIVQKCKYGKISYDKAYNDMQQKIEWLQAQLGDLKGKCKDTPCVSDTLDPLIISCENDKVIAPGMFRIDPLDITTKTRRPQPRSNTKNDRVPFASKSSWIKNKEVEVEEHHKNLLLSKNKKHMSSECNNVKLAIQNDKYKVVCAMCKQCLITANHDVCVLNYVNGMNSRGKKPKANVSNIATHTKLKPKVKISNKIGSKERLYSPNPRKPRTFLKWLLTGRIFDLKGKIIASSDSECQSDSSNGDNAYTSNPQEPLQSKGFQIPLLLFSSIWTPLPRKGSRCAMGYHRMRVHVDGSGRREDGSGGVGVGEEDVVA